MGDELINVRGLTVKAGRRILLDDLNWTVRKGEQWVVFGTNGSGKTTLLSAVAGYRRYSAGTIELFGEPVDAGNILEARRRIGWVSSSFFDNYYRNESAIEIVLAGKTGTLGIDYSVDEKDVRRAVDWLERFGLKDKRDMTFNTLSKGQRQTVLLIRALFNSPDILILDEPCSGLDIDARERVLAMVREFAQDGATTVIYVTHYAEEILDVFTHAILLKQGRRFASGTIGECLNTATMSGLLGRSVDVGHSEDGRLVMSLLGENGERGVLA